MTSTPTLDRRRQERRNSLRRMLIGLPRHSGAITPAVPDDRYQTLVSAYRFAAQLVPGRRVLDLSCGTGFGCRELARAGAASVLGLEQYRWAIRHARWRYRHRGLRFRVAYAESLPLDLGEFDLALGFNLLPRCADAEGVLEGLCRHLSGDGMLLTSTPVIRDEESLVAARRGDGRLTYLYPWFWAGILGAYFREVRVFRHLPPDGAAIDFSSPYPSLLAPEAFQWSELPPEDLQEGESLAAMFVCSGVR